MSSYNTVYEYVYRHCAPAVYYYTLWVIENAVKRGITRLYFLARDGYMLRKTAEEICLAKGLSIECRYLYVSRRALRLPTYSFIGEEAYSLLFARGYYATPRSVLARAEIFGEECVGMLGRLGVTDVERELDGREFTELCEALRTDGEFNNRLREASERAYAPAVEYLLGEGVCELDTLAIVDSGWTGSMQRSLRQLLETVGWCGRIVGFYFGMYREPKSSVDGEYLCYYFSASSGTARKVAFNNNLFECILSAPHAMTLGYLTDGGVSRPIFAEAHSSETERLIDAQIKAICDFVSEENTKCRVKSSAEMRNAVYKHLKRAMIYPTRAEAEAYSAFGFCDDVSEIYRLKLTDTDVRRRISEYLFFPRAFNKLFGTGEVRGAPVLWIYGIIACLPKYKQPWYRFNALLWDYIKSLRDKRNGGRG